MTAFTVDAARALPGPAWLRDFRAAAAERVAGRSLPTPDEEIWRYSRIAELDLERFRPSADGWSTTVTGGTASVMEPVAATDTGADVFAELNAAFAPNHLLLSIPPGKFISEPIVVDHHIGADGVAAFPRLIIDAGPDSEVTVLERFRSDDVDALVVPFTTINVGQAARVRYLAVNELGPRVWQIGAQLAEGERDSTTLIASVALGGDYARVHTTARPLRVLEHANGEPAGVRHSLRLRTGLRRRVVRVRSFRLSLAPVGGIDLGGAAGLQ